MDEERFMKSQVQHVHFLFKNDPVHHEYHNKTHFLFEIFVFILLNLSVFVGFDGLLHQFVIKSLQKAASNNVHNSINMNKYY